jgi:hypothetical protein
VASFSQKGYMGKSTYEYEYQYEMQYGLNCKVVYLILPTALGPGVYSASNRNEYQKHKNNNVSGE